MVHGTVRRPLRRARHTAHAAVQLLVHGDVARGHRTVLGAAADLPFQPLPRSVQGSCGRLYRRCLDMRDEFLLPRAAHALKGRKEAACWVKRTVFRRSG